MTLTKVFPLLVDEITVTAATAAEATQAIYDLGLDEDSFDYKLWTDGSGHQDGYGASAAIWRHRDGDTDTVFSMNYGQTVNRNELSAMLDGLSSILAHYMEWTKARLELPPGDVLKGLREGDRATVAWYTDRQPLACSMMWRADGEPLNRRSCDRDLWARCNFLTRYLCVVPYYVQRNTIAQQSMCDSICSNLRTAGKAVDGAVKLCSLGQNLPWTVKSQKASL